MSANENGGNETGKTARGEAASGDLAAEIAALSFEEALAELEKIVKSLEEGRQRLEEALAAYERGTLLRKHCEAKLAEVESRIEVIIAADDGAPIGTRPFTGQESSPGGSRAS